MSDEIYSIPIALWSVGVFGQVESAIRSWWSNRGVREEDRQLLESEWSKIQRGELKRGFRMWLERQCCPSKSILEEKSHFLVDWQFPNDYDWNEWVKQEPMSMFVGINHPTPNSGQIVSNLRRYSFLSPNVYTDIAQVITPHDERWWQSVFDMQLDDWTIASMYKNLFTDRMWVILFNIKQRSYRMLSVPPILPTGDGWITILYLCRGEGKHSNRLRIVCDISQWNQHEVVSIDYEIRPSKKHPSRLFAEEVSRQSIIIPGHRRYVPKSLPGTCVLEATEQNQSSYVVTIDQRGDFRIHPYDEWHQANMATDFERRTSKAVDDFDAVLPDQWSHGRYFYRFYKHIIANVGDSFAKRQIYAPSMMYRAAEAICKAKPDDDHSMLKSETGIDMFDGIHEDREKPVPSIYLPSNDEWMQAE